MIFTDGGLETHLCEAEEEPNTPEDLQSLCSMMKHHIPAGVTGTAPFTYLESNMQKKRTNGF